MPPSDPPTPTAAPDGEPAPDVAAVPAPSVPRSLPAAAASAAAESAGTVAQLVVARLGMWAALDGFTSRGEALGKTVSQRAGRGPSADLAPLTDGTDHAAELVAVEKAVRAETGHLDEIDRKVREHEAAIADIKRRQQMRTLLIVGGVVVAIILIAVLFGSGN